MSRRLQTGMALGVIAASSAVAFSWSTGFIDSNKGSAITIMVSAYIFTTIVLMSSEDKTNG